jgi:hypothetical protein
VKRGYVIGTVVVALAGLLLAWIADNTYWEDTAVPMPLRGEARTNPFYAAQRFAEALGARTSRGNRLTLPSPDAVLVLSGWHWSLSLARRQAIEQWVDAGGRLVVDASLIGGEIEFEKWSGIARELVDVDDDASDEAFDDAPETVEDEREDFAAEACRLFAEEGAPATQRATVEREVCHVPTYSYLRAERAVEWGLRDSLGLHAVRVRVGRGSVTVINATPFAERHLLDADHGWLFVSATQLGAGDHVVFASETDHPSLLTLVWQHGASVVVALLGLIGLSLWRAAVRLGPLVPAGERARRSLGEQIRGTGAFAVRHGDGASLHAACLRALDEVAQRRIPGYARMTVDERVRTISEVSVGHRPLLAAAIQSVSGKRSHHLYNTLAQIEGARRQLLGRQQRSSHGTR